MGRVNRYSNNSYNKNVPQNGGINKCPPLTIKNISKSCADEAFTGCVDAATTASYMNQKPDIVVKSAVVGAGVGCIRGVIGEIQDHARCTDDQDHGGDFCSIL